MMKCELVNFVRSGGLRSLSEGYSLFRSIDGEQVECQMAMCIRVNLV